MLTDKEKQKLGDYVLDTLGHDFDLFDMKKNDIISIEYLKEQGYRLLIPSIYEFEKGLPDMCVYHSKEKQLDIKILKIHYLPEMYTIDAIITTPKLIEALKVPLGDKT